MSASIPSDPVQPASASPTGKIRFFMRLATAAVVVVLLGLALHVLSRELSTTPPYTVLQEARRIPVRFVALSCLLTVLSYFVLTWYDFFGLRYAGYSLPYRKSAVASFIAYVFSHNLGFAEVSGTALRFHIYAAWGLNAIAITKAALFGIVTYWIGLGILGSVVFIGMPPETHLLGALPPALYHIVGGVFLLLVVLYFLAVLRFRAPLIIRTHEVTLPTPRLALIQLGLALADWLTTSGVLYAVLFPVTGLSYGEFLGIYIVAITAGSISHIPAGLGVIESIFVLALKNQADAGTVLGALLVYRAIYYLLPLIPGIIMLLGLELSRMSTGFRRFARLGQPWFSAVAPSLFAFYTFLSGLVLLVSGATPENWSRLHSIESVLPLASIEISHLLASVMGVALLITARGLQQRLDGAYVLTLFFLTAGAVFSMLKGFDYEEASFLMIAMFLLLPCRSFFYRRSSMLAARFSPAWIMAIVATVVASAWLAFLAHRNVEYSNELWWQFSGGGSAPRAFRASLAAAMTSLIAGLAWLLHPSQPRPIFQIGVDDTIRSIVQKSSRTMSNLAFTGDKEFLLNPAGSAFIMFARKGRHWITMGDPVGPEEETAELIWQFRTVCDSYAARPVFYQVDAAGLHRYIDAGFYVTKIGEEAIVQLADFHLEGRKFKDLRNARNRMEKMGFRFDVLPASESKSILPELKSISDAWLAQHKTREKGFSIGAFKEDYIGLFPLAIIRGDSGIEAFANLWQTADKKELSIDLMRYRPEAPHGIMDCLLCDIILWGKDQGFRTFNLGMAPLAGLNARLMSQPWVHLETLVYQHGEHFYNFRGLRAFKDKWEPKWFPKYLATSAGLSWPVVLVSLTALIGGGWRGALTKKARTRHTS
ncbi:MAG TPA: bifunctional lysylphosphatidylglycerol flippase/synthetase MprF [Oligoflexus sp.]|uniref:bifunctional lysylphosphatidylglycerol flippase/synthetase MprF n=1 Tax=Oligoflexus sp. TaxID=1971216 RepID=UPI002D7E9627|nr:bifunctional lysylphosphatidylglycerol flippase/synthetase MprF [Oligoflexus sp.]HET9236348.1 bifunctional lysylphosphatidylglycerol flippase/synthetase MprF [Oligoflexus sp.]